MLDTHRHHVQEDQDKDCNLEPSGERDIVEKCMIWVLRSLYHFLRFFPAQFFHGSVIVFLALSQKHLEHSSLVLERNGVIVGNIFIVYLLFQGIEIINDDTDEEVESEEGPTDDEDDKVEVVVEASLILWLLVHFPGIHSISHDLHPTLKGGLKKKIKKDQIRVEGRYSEMY